MRIGALAVAFIVTGLSMRPSAQDLPFRAEIVGTTGNTVEYVLTNDGPKTATAWTVEFTSTDSAGAKIRSSETTDNYVTTAHPQLDPQLQPNVFESQASRRLTARLASSPGATLVGVDVRAVAVVFEDGSAIGEASILDQLFARRQAERDTYAGLLALLRATRSKGSRAQDVKELVVNAERIRQKYPASNVAGGVIDSLRVLTDQVTKGTVDSDSELRALELMLTIQHGAAAKHAVRSR